jgi:hypothetical protein
VAEKDDDEKEHETQLKSMCRAGIKGFTSMKHTKAAELHAHLGKMHLHHAHGDEAMDDDGKEAIRKAYKDVPHCKAVHVAEKGPEDEEYKSLMKCKGGAGCDCKAMSKALDDEDEEEKEKEKARLKEEELRSKADEEDEDEDEDDEEDEDEDEEDEEDEDEEDEDEDEESKAAKDPYGAMCKDLKAAAAGIKHCGKAGHMFAHKGEMKAHWHAHDDDFDDDAEEKGYHSRSEIRAKCMQAKGCKGAVCSTAAPAGEMWEHIHPEKDKDPRHKAAAMGEAIGALGGYLVGAGMPAAGDEGVGDEEVEGIRRYNYVKLFSGAHHKACGRVHSVHKRGIVPGVENDVVASKDAPHARVQLYKSYGDGHVPTSIHVAHPVAKMERIDDLKPPSKKPMPAAVTGAMSKPQADPEPAPPPKKKPAKAAELPALPASPLSEDEVLNTHGWNLIQSGKLDNLIATAIDNGLARALGRG